MKEEILQTSVQQFLKYGIRKVSIQKLIEPLGISTKTVYKYYKNKEEILEEALNLMSLQSFKEWEHLVATEDKVSLFFSIWHKAVEAQSNVNKIFFEDLYYYYPRLHQKNEVRLTKKYKKQFIQIIQEGIEEGFFTDAIIPEVVFEGISILFKAITREGQFQTFRASSSEIMFNTIAPLIRGCCTEKGMERLEKCIQGLEIPAVKTSKKKFAIN